jgi:radical SAM protein with 4Fe4S-binding SPASM domain
MYKCHIKEYGDKMIENNNIFYFQWHITDRCNLRCKHCYQDNYTGETEISIQELENIADELLRTLSKWNKKGDLSITGGEPFLRKDLFSFLEYLNSSEAVCNLDILTNGTIITNDIVKSLKNISKLRRVQISLDGSSPQTHDEIRGKGTFDKTMESIRLLNSSDIDINIMFTLQRHNMDDIKSIIDLSIKENIKGLTIERMVPIGSAKKDSVTSPEDIRRIFQYISDRSDIEYEKGSRLHILKYRPLWINIDPCRAKKEVCTPMHKELGGICSIGLDGICITPDATVLSCRRLPIPIGNLKKESFENIWFNSHLLNEIANKNNLKGKCHSCKYIARCSGCRSMAYAITGDYLAEDPQCWK